MKTHRRLQLVNAGRAHDLGLAQTPRTATSPSMKLLAAKSALFECLWCAHTTRAMFAHAGAQIFFASKHARLRRTNATATLYCCRHERERLAIPRRSQLLMRGLACIAKNFKIIMRGEHVPAMASKPIVANPIDGHQTAGRRSKAS